jgi:hypothetical protein
VGELPNLEFIKDTLLLGKCYSLKNPTLPIAASYALVKQGGLKAGSFRSEKSEDFFERKTLEEVVKNKKLAKVTLTRSSIYYPIKDYSGSTLKVSGNDLVEQITDLGTITMRCVYQF